MDWNRLQITADILRLTSMRTRICLATALVILPNGHAQTLWQIHGEKIYESAVTIPRSEFSDGSVAEMCDVFLREHRDDFVLRYLIATDAQEGYKLRGKPTDVTFEGWRRAYLSNVTAIAPAAELVRLGDRASVRLRYADGTVTERILERRQSVRN